MITTPKSEEDRRALTFAMRLSLAVGLLMFVMKVGAYPTPRKTYLRRTERQRLPAGPKPGGVHSHRRGTPGTCRQIMPSTVTVDPARGAFPRAT